VRRRRPLEIPYAEAAADLESLVSGRTVCPADAGAFTDAVRYHGLAGYAVEAIGCGRLVLARGEARRLADAQARRLLHAALLRRELGAAVTALGAIGVAPLLVKGPAVANRYYRDPALRTFADLDLLVPRQRLADGVAALADVGYSVAGEYRPDYPDSLYHDVHLERSVGNHHVDLDLHWRLGDDPLTVRLDHDALAKGADAIDVDGTTISVPALPEQLLALAVHFLSDVARRLIWINDLVLIARAASEEQWRAAFALADELELGWPLHRALDYAGRYLALDRPRPTAPPETPPFGPIRALEELDARGARHAGRLAAIGWRERAVYLRALLAPSRATLEATVGLDGASTPRLLARHVRQVLTSGRSRVP
jgi:hypothetical protein